MLPRTSLRSLRRRRSTRRSQPRTRASRSLTFIQVWYTATSTLRVAFRRSMLVSNRFGWRRAMANQVSAELPAQFIVWACSDEAKWTRTGDKLLWCNWDVEELQQRKGELEKPNQLTITMNGWPFEGQDDSSGSLKF